MSRAAGTPAPHGGKDVKQSSCPPLAVRRVDESCTVFAAFDRSLRTAAATEGFELMPSDLPDPETA